MKKTFITSILLLVISTVGYSLVFAAGDASLELKPSVTDAKMGDEFTVDIELKNPGAQSVISVRSWLEYNPAALSAENIDTSKSAFTLAAPGEDEVNAGEGHVQIGRSNISGGVTDAESTVATVRFRVLAGNAQTSEIKFYDYQVSELGHTSVNIIDSGFPVNILSEEPKSIKINLNPGGAPIATPVLVTTNPAPVTTLPADTGMGGGTIISSSLLPAVNLRANTGSGYVDLKWDSPADSYRAGYNIYYGKVSGQYSRRRSIGDYDNYRIEGLTNNETFYFAVTSYDLYNQESDYSNEVGIIVNQPLSSTNPYANFIQQALARIPAQPQNGPLTGWLLFSATGLSGAIFYGRRKRNLKSENAVD